MKIEDEWLNGGNVGGLSDDQDNGGERRGLVRTHLL
jgi:hypothetical protein